MARTVKLAPRRRAPLPDAAPAPQAAPLPLATPAPLRFGPGGRFELQPAERRLLVDGEPAALGARALDLLIALAGGPTTW